MSTRKNYPSPVPQKKTGLLAILAALGLNSLLISILVHVFFIVLATVIVVEVFQKKHNTFQETPPQPPNTDVEHKVEIAKKNSVDSAPPDLKRITTTSISPITLPDPPEISNPNDDVPPTISGLDGISGSSMGSGTGIGVGLGQGSPFGSFDATDAPLVGYLIDLKQNPDGTPTGMTPDKYHEVLKKFVAQDWDPSILDVYYKSPRPLNASYIFVPTIHADDGPAAFGVEKEVQPRMYVAWYKATVSASEAGYYHFVGMADDVLLVRVNGQTVLDGCLSAEDRALWDEEKRYPVIGYKATNPEQDKGLHVGRGFQVSITDQVNIDILIGERPGGWSNYFLYIQKDDATYPTQANNTPLLPIFHLSAGEIDPKGKPGTFPPFLKSADSW